LRRVSWPTPNFSAIERIGAVHFLEHGGVQRMSVGVLVFSLPLRAAFLRSTRGIVDPI